jgi:hypothetical protein
MKIADKNTRYYWDIIKLPLAVYVLLFIISIMSVHSLILPALIVAAGYVGYVTVNEKGGRLTHAAVAGLFFGLISSLIMFLPLLIYLELFHTPRPNELTSRLSTILTIFAIMLPFFTVLISILGGVYVRETMKKSQ